ncbi:MAG: hypothetical protein ABIG11_09175 [bacterium]
MKFLTNNKTRLFLAAAAGCFIAGAGTAFSQHNVSFNPGTAVVPLTPPSPFKGEGKGEGKQKSSGSKDDKLNLTAESGFKEALKLAGLIKKGGGEFRIDKSNQRGDWKSDRRCYWTLICSSGTKILRMEIAKNISLDYADKMMRERWTRIKMLYSGNAAYPGMLTQKFEVPDELKPVLVSSGTRGQLTGMLYGTVNMTYGAGSQDLAVYRSIVTFLYCAKSATSAQIELFIPKKEFSEESALKEAESFMCR